MFRCPVNGCTAERKREHVMCRRHWKMVPAHLQRLVWQYYRMDPGSERHMEAVADVIEAVEMQEGTYKAERGTGKAEQLMAES